MNNKFNAREVTRAAKPSLTFHRYKAVSLCVALMGAAVPVWAQSSSVTIFGLLDEGVEHVTGLTPKAGAGNADYRVGSGTAASRWGFRGTEDLGGGMKAFFTLESGMSMDTGTLGQNGRIFGRQAFVAIASPYGTVALGRQYTMRYFSFLDADLFGAGSQGLGDLDSGFPNARVDNAISYRADLGGFSAGVNYSFGRDGSGVATGCAGETTDSHQCRDYSAMLKYDASNWGVSTSYERAYTVATGGSPASTTLTLPNATDTRFLVGSYLNLGELKFAGGWVRRVNEANVPTATKSTTPKSNLFWLATSVPVTTAISIDSMLATLVHETYEVTGTQNKALLFTLRANYALSKRTRLYLSGAHISNHGNLDLAATTNAPAYAAAPGRGQTSIFAGIRHTF